MPDNKNKKDDSSVKKTPTDKPEASKKEEPKIDTAPTASASVVSAENQIKSAEGEKDKKGRRNKSNKLIWGIVVGVFVFLLLIIIGGGFYAYYTSWDDDLSETITSVIPYPAVTLNYKSIAYKDFQKDMATLRYFYDKQAEENPELVQTPTDEYLKKSVLSRMLREEYLFTAAEEYTIDVDQSEIDKEMEVITNQSGGVSEVESTLKDLYNWTIDEFKAKVIKPYVYRTAVQEYISDSDEINAEAKAQAEKVLTEVKAGDKTFEELAKEYSEDTSASSGGDLGFFGKGEMVAPFEEAVFSLEPGEVSDIVKTQYGYHIIKLIEKVPADDEGTGEQVHAAHILIKTTDVDTWINDELAKQNVQVFLPGYEFKEDCGLILGNDETCEDNELLQTTSFEQVNGAAGE